MYGSVRQSLLYASVRRFCVPAADLATDFTRCREMLHGAHKQKGFLGWNQKQPYRVYGVYGNFEVRFSFSIRQRIDYLNAHKPTHPLAADMDIVGGLHVVKPLILCKLRADRLADMGFCALSSHHLV